VPAQPAGEGGEVGKRPKKQKAPQNGRRATYLMMRSLYHIDPDSSRTKWVLISFTEHANDSQLARNQR
jgi:hypothetical protein